MSETWTTEQDAAFRAAAANGHIDATGHGSWWPVDLAPIVAGIQAGEIVGPVPQIMRRDDQVALLYPGEVHSLAGEPETGKGWIALAAAGEVLAAGGHVLYVDCEDAPASIVGRLLALNIPAQQITERFVYVRPTDPLIQATLDALLATRGYQLAIIDGLSEAYTLLGLDPYSNVDAARFLTQLARPIAAAGAAVLLIDHVIKNKDARGRFALGAQHKLAGIAVAYTTDAITPPSRAHAGLIKLKVEKDRHGHIRSHASGSEIATVHITPHHDGHQVTVTLEAPEASYTDTGEWRPTILMRRIWEYVHDNPGATRNTIRSDVDGSNEHKDKALKLLITEGYIHRQTGPRNAHHHHINRSLDDLTEPTGPDRADTEPPAHSDDRAHRAPPLKGPSARAQSTTTPHRAGK